MLQEFNELIQKSQLYSACNCDAEATMLVASLAGEDCPEHVVIEDIIVLVSRCQSLGRRRDTALSFNAYDTAYAALHAYAPELHALLFRSDDEFDLAVIAAAEHYRKLWGACDEEVGMDVEGIRARLRRKEAFPL